MGAASPTGGRQATGVDVLVVGLGPTGATLTALLAQKGLRVAAFDRLPGLYPLPRAIGLDHEVMRIMQEIGIAGALAPYIEPYRPSEYYGVDGQLIKRLDAAPPPHELGWVPNYVFNQPEFERVLRCRLAEFPRVETHLLSEVVGFGQGPEIAWVDVRRGDRIDRFEGRYLIACDGGTSGIRKGLGIELEDLGFDETWIVVDAIVSDKKCQELPATQVQYCDPRRPATFVVVTGNHRRWEIRTLPGEAVSADLPEAELWPLLSRWLTPEDGRLWRAATYRFHGLVAREWRRKRILLAGDSAHMTPPFMAQGMVQGVRDAHNLAWKLARVIRGESADALLDNYGAERRPHVIATTLKAIELGRVICERDLEQARERDARMIAANGGVVTTEIRQDFIPGLCAGLLGDGGDGVGTLCPQPMLESSGQTGAQRLDDVAGCGWRLIVAEAIPPEYRIRIEAAVTSLRGVVVAAADGQTSAGSICDSSGMLRDWLLKVSARYAVVRPDHYVYGFATGEKELLEQLTGLHEHLRSGVRGTTDCLPHASVY